jgi:hypothetical protein
VTGAIPTAFQKRRQHSFFSKRKQNGELDLHQEESNLRPSCPEPSSLAERHPFCYRAGSDARSLLRGRSP